LRPGATVPVRRGDQAGAVATASTRSARGPPSLIGHWAGVCLGRTAGLSTASRTFRVVHRLTVILSLRRIRDPSARGDEVRILRLRSQARFAQDDTALA